MEFVVVFLIFSVVKGMKGQRFFIRQGHDSFFFVVFIVLYGAVVVVVRILLEGATPAQQTLFMLNSNQKIQKTKTKQQNIINCCF